LPFSAGILILAGVLLDDRPPRWRWTGPFVLCGALAAGLGHVVSVVAVFVRETDNPVATASATWPAVPVVGIALLALAGVAVLTAGVRIAVGGTSVATPDTTEVTEVTEVTERA
jgi:hypothetical protein